MSFPLRYNLEDNVIQKTLPLYLVVVGDDKSWGVCARGVGKGGGGLEESMGLGGKIPKWGRGHDGAWWIGFGMEFKLKNPPIRHKLTNSVYLLIFYSISFMVKTFIC